jgi:galactokinase
MTTQIPSLFHLTMRALRDVGAATDRGAHAFFVPGRIEVLGKHTDYAGGRSLLAAVERGFVVVAVPRADERVVVIDAVDGERVAFEAGEVDDASVAGGRPSWTRYPAAVLRRMERNFPDAAGGVDLAFASDLPPAAGLSSSSALVVATFLALGAVRRVGEADAYRAAIHADTDLAGYLGAVENGLDFGPLAGTRGVGTMGGSEDHTAILCARADELVQYSFAPVRFERAVPMPADHVFVVATSGVRAEKAGSALEAYNRLARQTRRLVELWREHAAHPPSDAAGDDTLGAILASGPHALDRLRDVVRAQAGAGAATGADALLRRLDQFVAETDQIIPRAATALERGDLATFGSEVARSQDLAERVLDNQIPETSGLVDMARERGAVAASAFGAGFGGSVWALVRGDEAAAFQHAWRAAYVQRFPERAESCTVFVTHAAPAASRL